MPDICDELAANERQRRRGDTPVDTASSEILDKLTPSVPMPGDIAVQSLVLGNVREAGQLLTRAYAAAFARNPMSAEVPAFKELTSIAQRLNTLMQEISKVRGL